MTRSVASEYAYVHSAKAVLLYPVQGGWGTPGRPEMGGSKPFRSIVTGWSDSTLGGILSGNYQPKEEPPPELALLEGVRH